MTHHMLCNCLVVLLAMVLLAITSPVAARRFAVPKHTVGVNTVRGGDDMKPRDEIMAARRFDVPRGGGDDKTAKWLEACQQLAPITSILCSMAPLPTIHEISETKSVGGLPLLPYSSMTANGFIWTLYGSLVDSPQVKWTGIVGAVLGGYYFKEFIKYIPKKELYQQHITVLAIIILMNTYIYYKYPKRKAAEVIGKVGVLLYIILFSSPLIKLKNVIESKSAVSIPLSFTITSTLNCSLWTIVGMFLMNDYNVYFPAAMGLSSALAQLLLKGIYAGDSAVA